MDTREIIRQLLDVLDQQETTPDSQDGIDVQRVSGDDDVSRFRQIFNLLDKGEKLPTANTPNEKYAGVDAVTKLAGGGVNGPKHPADIRVKDPRQGE